MPAAAGAPFQAPPGPYGGSVRRRPAV